MITDHASKLLQAACDASFACGEWVKDDDEPYDRVYADSATAYEAIAGYIVELEAACRRLLEGVEVDSPAIVSQAAGMARAAFTAIEVTP